MLCVVILAANCKKDDTTTPTPPADARDIFIGNFHMSDSVKYYSPMPGEHWEILNVDIVISKNQTYATKINITNLNKSGYTVTADVSSSLFIITSQPFGNNTGFNINGTGRIENNKLYYDYVTNAPGAGATVRGQGTKFTK